MGLRKENDLCFLGLILVEVCRLFFTHTKIYGRSLESLMFAREYFATLRVRWEKYSGPDGLILEHVAGKSVLHIFGVLVFLSLEIKYSCITYEFIVVYC